MFSTLKTLVIGASARAEERVRDTYSIELIDQKIREAEGNLKAAKTTLATLIQRQRNEARQMKQIDLRIEDLMTRAQDAIAGDREDLARMAARAVADLENEQAVRRETADRLEARVFQLRQTLETAHRRVLDLKQGAIAARAVQREQSLQTRLNRHVGGESPIEEAEALIARVMQRDDPFEQAEILRDIDADFDHSGVAHRMEEAGFGPKTRSTEVDVMTRLKPRT